MVVDFMEILSGNGFVPNVGGNIKEKLEGKCNVYEIFIRFFVIKYLLPQKNFMIQDRKINST